MKVSHGTKACSFEGPGLFIHIVVEVSIVVK